MSEAPADRGLLVDDDSGVVTTKAAQPRQRPVGDANFVKWPESHAVESLAVLRDRRYLQTGAKARLKSHRVGI
jgi:hypothetical protein